MGIFGYGLFAARSIARNQVIGVYQGETLGPVRADVQEVLARFTNRNYLFELSNSLEDQPGAAEVRNLTVDAAEAGNGMRFANYEGKQCNAWVTHEWSNGDLVLAVRATKPINKNEEIFLDYGPLYFQQSKDTLGRAAASIGGDRIYIRMDRYTCISRELR
ncbi:hypothetical protein BKA62DRAFT_810718 [Auriculariales sp. MPI-PUGE-AT-0066]|nr:hypothetical protein BKA62DRAFT_810718 [Auriculariales sp. MPI-PUGE-AT-0066]